MIGRSDDFVIYRLGSQDTNAALAGRFYGDQNKVWLIEDTNDSLFPRRDDLVVIPLKPKRKGGLFENGYQGVPVLCYHQFINDSDSPLAMPARSFDLQMKYLKENGYRVISPSDLQVFMNFEGQIPKKAVMITIDDGYHSIYDIAYPILKKYGFTATLFIYTSYVGISGKALSWDELRELKAAGFTIGSHSVSHSDLTKMDPGETLEDYYKRVELELRESKKIIDQNLDQDTLFFSYPYGRSNAEILEIAKAVGYSMAFTVDRGNNPFFSNPLDLKRDMVLKRDMQTFISRLNTFTSISLK